MQNIYAQQSSINLKLDNVSVKQVFQEIEKSGNYVFIYNDKVVDLNRKVIVNVQNGDINAVLEQVFKGTNNSYKINKRQITIIKKSKDQIDSEQNAANGQITKKTITGSITDDLGEPLPGVSVIVKGTTTGTITDMDGNYTISDVPSNASLQFSFIGMSMQEFLVGNQLRIDVKMMPDAIGLDEVVAVGYGAQRKASITGAISKVASKQITMAPVANPSNALAGTLPGLIVHQTSGQPGQDAANLSIRGFGNALVIVDGVEADINQLDPNSIESISILKDGSAAIYGSRAGNGVILVTTKRGNNDKPVISLNAAMTFQGITTMPQMVSSGQYAELMSETHLQSGKPAETVPYTLTEIQKYYEEADPYLYPNTDWFDYLVRDWAPQQQYNLSVKGGSEKIKYYGLVGYTEQESMWKKSGGTFKRFNIQSNIDAQISDDLSIQLDFASIYEDRLYPYVSQGNTGGSAWQHLWSTLPIYPSELPDPSKISYGGGNGGAHISTNADLIGTNDTENHVLKGTLSINYDFSKLIKGLKARAFVNTIQSYRTRKVFLTPVEFFLYEPLTETYILNGTMGGSAPNLNESRGRSRTTTGQFSLNYDRTFAQDHKVKGLLLSEFIDYSTDNIGAARRDYLSASIPYLYAGSTVNMTNSGSATEMGRSSIVGRINYAYKDKYLLEAILRADASAKFSSEERWGFFPSVSMGWRISEEGFLENVDYLDNLKMRVSYGEMGNDGVGNFQYLSGYAFNSSYILGEDPQQGIVSTGLANPYLTWEEMTIYNLGMDFSLMQRKLYGEFDVFYRTRDGIPATRLASLPSTLGAELPQENINSQNNRGFELMLGNASNLGDFRWDVNANVSWSRAKWDHFEEPDYEDEDQKRVYGKSGQWTDRAFGYISNGLFTSQEEIDNLLFDQDQQGNITLNPGDVRYVDVNQDGFLDWRDQVEIGKGTTPNWMMGTNINLNYKNFDMSARFQGAWGYYTWIKLHPYSVEAYDNRWTPENNDRYALVPRYGGAATNNTTSDYFYKEAGYLRLKVFSLGYNLPERWLNRINFRQARIYFSGTNLLTFSSMNKYNTDPEAPSGGSGMYYPQQKTLSLGLNLSF
ncbi:TonB-dependent receptor [Carboxylicivirga sp. RSCT41]|uniref:TonB-dependent receptor n=1 Tax=Carboxylicivirga agarovorans TaxID=3417570 RepID=UPI003D32D37D